MKLIIGEDIAQTEITETHVTIHLKDGGTIDIEAFESEMYVTTYDKSGNFVERGVE